MLVKIKKMQQQQTGFSLIEIAVVLVIIGLLVGSFIGTFAARIDTTRYDNTEKELEEIKQVIFAFAYTRLNPHFPCPDTDIPPDGTENREGSGECTAVDGVSGTLPWIDLGVGYSDAWNTRYGYWVNDDYADNAGFNLATDDIVDSATINTRKNDVAEGMVANAVVVIYSRGKNGLGGISVEDVLLDAVPALGNGHDDEIENVNDDSIFMSRVTTQEGVASAGGAFDDIVVWIGAYEAMTKMVEAGRLP